MSTPPIQPERYHALDALRASMMGLGIVLHSAVNYMQTPVSVWPIKDSATNATFDLLFYFIHLFRMPVFFVSAGFFAALLYGKRGTTGMLKNRAQRVLLPLLLAFILIIPVFKMSFAFTMNGGGEKGWAAAANMLTSFSVFRNMHLAHLWFLQYLLFLYGAALLLLSLLKHRQNLVPVRVQHALSAHLVSASTLVALTLLTFLTLIPMTGAAPDTHVSLIPAPHLLLAYSVFFAYGWLLYGHWQQLMYFKAHWKTYLIAGLAGSALYLFVYLAKPVTHPVYADLSGKGLAALVMWLMVYASIGLFERYCSKPSPVIRYLSDASYWMYLVHLPVVIILVGLLTGITLPAVVKFTLVMTGTLLFTLLTYHLLVRSTAIGVLLNGRRYPRALPQATPEPLQAA